jgi:uncharacterized protein YaaQ
VKLVVAIVHSDDAGSCTNALTDAGYDCTRLGTSGGFLQKGNATLLVGIDDLQVDAVIDVLRACARGRNEFINPVPATTEPVELFAPFPVEVEIGGATVFVLDVERFERL